MPDPITVIVQPETIEVAITGAPGRQGIQGPPGATTIAGVDGLQAALDGKAPTALGKCAVGTTAPTVTTGQQVLWVDTTGGHARLKLVTGD